MAKNTKRRHRRWTISDQTTAEVAAACGCSLSQIAKILGRTPIGVSLRLNIQQAQRQREQHKKWRNLNQEKSKETSRRWKANNKEKRREYNNRWKEQNMEKYKEKSRRQRARRRNAINRSLHTVDLLMLGKLNASFGHCCAYCGCSEKMSIDHVIPLAKNGLHEISNFLPACQRCNSSKQDNDVKEWYFNKPFFDHTRWLAILSWHPWLAS